MPKDELAAGESARVHGNHSSVVDNGPCCFLSSSGQQQDGVHRVLCFKATDGAAVIDLGALHTSSGPVPKLPLFLIHQWTDVGEIQ